MTNLPLDGAFARSIGAITPGWGNAEELLAAVLEHVDQGNRILFMAHSKKGTTPPKPLVVPRPSRNRSSSSEPPRRRMASPAEVRRFFGARRNASTSSSS